MKKGIALQRVIVAILFCFLFIGISVMLHSGIAMKCKDYFDTTCPNGGCSNATLAYACQLYCEKEPSVWIWIKCTKGPGKDPILP